MNKLLLSVAISLLLLGGAYAEENTLKEGAKEVGRATGNAVREVGQGTKKVATEIGHATRDAAKEVGHATRDGAKEFASAVKGESKDDGKTDPKPETKDSSRTHLDK